MNKHSPAPAAPGPSVLPSVHGLDKAVQEHMVDPGSSARPHLDLCLTCSNACSGQDGCPLAGFLFFGNPLHVHAHQGPMQRGEMLRDAESWGEVR